MILALIAAHDDELAIGKDGGLPWHIPGDLKYFKQKTLGYPIVMGRRTFESIGEKPLPRRENVVISGTKEWPGITSFTTLNEALTHLAQAELVYIVGGSVLYSAAISLADQLVLTLVRGTHSGDTFFPDYREDIGTIWEEVFREEHETHCFVTYQRITKEE